MANGLALLALFNRADQRYPRKPCVADDSGMLKLDHRGSTVSQSEPLPR